MKPLARLRGLEPERTKATRARDASTSRALVRLDDAYLPLTALAEYAGLSVRTLRGYLASRTRPLSYYRVGGKILVRRSDFDAWAAQFRVTVPAVVMDTIVEELCRDFG